MGYRFNLEHANWLAHVLQSAGATPQLEDEYDTGQVLKEFVDSFEENFYPSPRHDPEFRFHLMEAMHELREFPERRGRALEVIRRYFDHVPWVALLIPTQEKARLSEEDLLHRLVRIRPDERGVILQIKDAKSRLSLDHVFPAFKVALAESTKWPGVLIWTGFADAVFLPVRKEEEVLWIFERLSRNSFIPDLAELKRDFLSNFAESDRRSPPLTLVHLSDIHLGSDLAIQKLPRIKALIRRVVTDLESAGPVLPVITGDLMDTPNQSNLQRVRDFVDFLNEISGVDPLVLLGNHDMRDDGWLGSTPSWALDIPVNRMFWHDDCEVGISCFNSARGGHLARGRIGISEFEEMGTLLDKERDRSGKYTLLAALHHHPISVKQPEWYQKRWYERLLGGSFEETGVLEDAEHFLVWCGERKVRAVLHGHKHIPRWDKQDNLTVIGCGSTIGKVKTKKEYETYISLNLVTVDSGTQRINCRLLAERVPGGGLKSSETHEMFFADTSG